MCDANDYEMGAVLGQRTEKIFKGTLKSEVRTSFVMHQSYTQSTLVLRISVQFTLKSLLLLSGSLYLCHSQGSWKS